MTMFSDEEIAIAILTSVHTGISSGSLPEGFVLPEKTQFTLFKLIRNLRPVIDDNDKALITLCMGFIEGFRHGRGENINADLSIM